MTARKGVTDRLGYLVREMRMSESEVLAKAVEQGLATLYRAQIADKYLRGSLSRDVAVAELGSEAVTDLDYAKEAVDSDVEWGLKSA